MNFLFNRSQSQDSKRAPKAQVGDEVGGMLDAFVSLEDIAPSLDWMETIADSWGIPHNATSKASKALDE